MLNELNLEIRLEEVFEILKKDANIFTIYPMDGGLIVENKKYFLTDGFNSHGFKQSGKCVPKYEILLSDNVIRNRHYLNGRYCNFTILNSKFDGAKCKEDEIEIRCSLSPEGSMRENKKYSIVVQENTSAEDIVKKILKIMQNFDDIYIKTL